MVLHILQIKINGEFIDWRVSNDEIIIHIDKLNHENNGYKTKIHKIKLDLLRTFFIVRTSLRIKGNRYFREELKILSGNASVLECINAFNPYSDEEITGVEKLI